MFSVFLSFVGCNLMDEAGKATWKSHLYSGQDPQSEIIWELPICKFVHNFYESFSWYRAHWIERHVSGINFVERDLCCVVQYILTQLNVVNFLLNNNNNNVEFTCSLMNVSAPAIKISSLQNNQVKSVVYYLLLLGPCQNYIKRSKQIYGLNHW